MAVRADIFDRATVLAFPPMVAAGFLRLVTNRRVFVEPDSREEAIAFVDAVIESPGVKLGNCGDEWPLLRHELLTRAVHGNLVTDAWIASSVEALAEHLVTFDRDFAPLLPARDFTVLGSAN